MHGIMQEIRKIIWFTLFYAESYLCVLSYLQGFGWIECMGLFVQATETWTISGADWTSHYAASDHGLHAWIVISKIQLISYDQQIHTDSYNMRKQRIQIIRQKKKNTCT